MNLFGSKTRVDAEAKKALRIAEITDRQCRRQRLYKSSKGMIDQCDPQWPCADLCPVKLTAGRLAH